MNRVAATVLLLALLGTASCGEPVVVISEVENVSRTPEVPPWAKVAPEQSAEAKKHGVPVAFENDLGMRFVLIPAGTFLMGTPIDGEGTKSCPWPRHEVTLAEPFYMQIEEVTNAQYKRWKRDHSSGDHKGLDLDGDEQPVGIVSWDDASQFAVWLERPGSDLSGRTDQQQKDGSRYSYGLPTEEQWEYACRAGTTTRFWWGDSKAEGWRYANAKDIEAKKDKSRGSAVQSLDDGYRAAAPVGAFPANAWGLHDMLGNVWEWCLDFGGPPLDPGDSSRRSRAMRGGSWSTPRTHVRCDYSLGWPPDRPIEPLGFRLVSPLPGPKSSK